jgi:hypothetical protein
LRLEFVMQSIQLLHSSSGVEAKEDAVNKLWYRDIR